MQGSLLKQYSITYISAEYKAIGMNVTSIQTAYMLRIGMFMLLLTLASAAGSIIVGYLSARIAAGLGHNLRRKLFVRVESFSNTEFDKFSTASLITRSTNDITQIQMLMVMLFRIVFYAPILAVGGIIKVIGADSVNAVDYRCSSRRNANDDGYNIRHCPAKIQVYSETGR